MAGQGDKTYFFSVGKLDAFFGAYDARRFAVRGNVIGCAQFGKRKAAPCERGLQKRVFDAPFFEVGHPYFAFRFFCKIGVAAGMIGVRMRVDDRSEMPVGKMLIKNFLDFTRVVFASARIDEVETASAFAFYAYDADVRSAGDHVDVGDEFLYVSHNA